MKRNNTLVAITVLVVLGLVAAAFMWNRQDNTGMDTTGMGGGTPTTQQNTTMGGGDAGGGGMAPPATAPGTGATGNQNP